MQDTFDDKLSIAKLHLHKLDSHLYNVSVRIAIVQGETIASDPKVRGSTNGVSIFLTPAWEAASLEKQITTLTHEIGHVALLHIPRMKKLPQPVNTNIAGIAADLALLEMQVGFNQECPIKKVYPDWQNYIGMSFEEIYHKLMEKEDQQPEYESGHEEPTTDEDEDGEEGEGSGTGLPEPTPEEWEELENQLGQAAQQAQASGCSTALSKASGRSVDDVRSPKIRWEQHLQKVLSSRVKARKSFKRPNKRLRHIARLPSREKGYEFLAVEAMDVSGSVGQKALNKFASIATDLLQNFVTDLHLMTFDDKIVDEWFLKSADKITDLKLNGCGGTYPSVIYDHLEQMKCKPHLLIITSDGYFSVPPDPGYPVIWLITDNTRFKPDYGKVIFIDTQEDYR